MSLYMYIYNETYPCYLELFEIYFICVTFDVKCLVAIFSNLRSYIMYCMHIATYAGY